MDKYYSSNLKPFIDFSKEETSIEPINNENVTRFFNSYPEYICKRITNDILPFSYISSSN